MCLSFIFHTAAELVIQEKREEKQSWRTRVYTIESLYFSGIYMAPNFPISDQFLLPVYDFANPNNTDSRAS